MRHDWIKRAGSDCLTVFMLGWASDPNLLAGYTPGDEEGDLLCFYDYHDLGVDKDVIRAITRYPHRRLEAWSFGVWAAEQVFGDVVFESAVAIGGTPLPVDETYGIPPKNFALTVSGIRRAGAEKFIERMCGGRIDDYMEHPSRRTIEDISSELCTLAELFDAPAKENVRWSEAVIGAQDLIFPPQAQQKYWQSKGVPYTLIDGMPHYFR